jgi:hypothetical protein
VEVYQRYQTVKPTERGTFGSSTNPVRTTFVRPTCSFRSSSRQLWRGGFEGDLPRKYLPRGARFGERANARRRWRTTSNTRANSSI